MSIATSAISYASRGWKLVQLYGVVQPSVCTCWKGKDCGTPGKHPVEKAWQLSATSDEEVVDSWFEDGRNCNIGIMLGRESGVIDVELDGKDAQAAWNELDLGEVWTPTYTSGRGPHRLFRWDPELPNVSVKKPLGIEVRIGNSAGIQSVLPPSTHHSGSRYEWVPGLSPDDVELAPLPERLRSLLFNGEMPGRTISRVPASALIHRKVVQGERNTELHRFAVREAFRASSMDDPTEQQDLLMKIRMCNSLNIVPPLEENEVSSIFRSACDYVRKTQSAGMDAAAAIEQASKSVEQCSHFSDGAAIRSWHGVFTARGLSYVPLRDGWQPEWGPGEWRLTVIHSDPIEYRLHIPALCRKTSDGRGNISLTVDQYRSSTKVASAVLAATGTEMLDDEPGRWKKIWDGGEKIFENSSGSGNQFHKSRGVKAKLLDNASHEKPGTSSMRYAQLASWLYDKISQAAQPNEEDMPDSSGRPVWRKDQTLWFSWSKVWEDMERQHKIHEGERLALKRRLLARLDGESKDFRHSEYRHKSGARKSYVVWTVREVAVLEEVANETPRLPESAIERMHQIESEEA